MDSGIDLTRTLIKIEGDFEGPNFVRGLALQHNTYTVTSDTTAILKFRGGFDHSMRIVQEVYGTGFAINEDTGRYEGIVTGYHGYDYDNPENGWTFSELDVPLDTLNENASNPDVTFGDLLLIPLLYGYTGAEYGDIYIFGSFDDWGLGLGGDDRFTGLTGDDSLYGMQGADTLLGNDGNDELIGGRDEDVLAGGDGNDFLDGGRHDDLLIGGSGNDTILGGTGDNTIKGGGGDDLIVTEGGRDRIDGGAGSDTIDAGAGEDNVQGGAGADVVSAGDDDDRVYGGRGDDSLSGDDGNDTLSGADGGDSLYGGDGDDVLNGGGGTNFLFGDDGDDILRGDDGTDELFGGNGNDTLASGTAADYVVGGLGDDRISANGGAPGGDLAVDNLIFEGAFGNDVITDFEVGFDSIRFGPLIRPGDTTVTTQNDNVLVEVDGFGSILVQGVATTFDSNIDLIFVPLA